MDKNAIAGNSEAARAGRPKKEKTTSPEVAAFTSSTGMMTIPGVRTAMLTTLIIGTAPLVVHKFSEKAIQMMLDKHTGKASGGREHKDPVANFQAAAYRLSDGSYGIPAGGVKAAIVDACDIKAGLAKAKAKGFIRVVADDLATNLVRIIGPEIEDQPDARHDYDYDGPAWPRLRQDLVRNESGVADIRHRPEFFPWGMRLTLEYHSSVSPSQVLQAIAMAGFSVGLCEWRPKSKSSLSGTLGTWRLASAEEIEQFEQDRLFKAAAAVSKPKLVAAE